MLTMPGSTARIDIRRHKTTDADSLYAAVRESIETMSPWLVWCSERYTLSDAKSFIEVCQRTWDSGTAYPFAIVDRETDELLGGVGINQLNTVHRFGNVGYWVRRTYTGAGIATEALRRVSTFAFDNLRLNRLEIVARPENAASRRVAEKAGAHFECLARNRLFEGRQLYIGALYSLVPEDLKD